MGFFEAILLVGLVIIIFGSRQMPRLGKALGQTIKNFKVAASGNEIDVTEESRRAQLKQDNNDNLG